MMSNRGPRIKLAVCEEPLTSNGGFVVLSDLWDALGVSGLIDEHLPQPGSGRGFAPSVMVRSIVTVLHNGGEHLSDVSKIAKDPVLLASYGLKKFPASNTLTEWLGRCERWVRHSHGGGLENVTLQGVEEVNRKLLGILARKLNKKSLTLDIDASIVKTGKSTARITYKNYRGYQPQLGYLAELRTFVASEFRNGDEPSSKDVVPYLQRCKAGMPEGTSIGVVRADAAYYQRDVLKWCKNNGSDFVIRAYRDSGVMPAVYKIPEADWKPYFDSDGIEQSDTEVASGYHSMDGTGWFRLAVLRRRREKGEQYDLFDGKYSYFPIATSMKCSAQQVVHFYNQRGRIEDGIGQLKQDFGLSSMPCSDTKANAVWIAIGMLAFTLFVLLKSLVLGGGWVVRKAKTVRQHFVSVPGKLVRHARQVTLKLRCSPEFVRFLDQRRKRCRELAAELG